MGFEARTLHGDSDRIKIDVLVDGTKFSMPSMSYRLASSGEEEYWDNVTWLKNILHTALWKSLYGEDLVGEYKEALDGIYHKDYIEMWGLLEQAKVLGWLEGE